MSNFWSSVGNFFTEKSAFERLGDLWNGAVDRISKLNTQLTNAFGQNTAQQQNAFNAEQAQQNRDFQERMSNTSWQRGLEDMQKAGLNSALAYSQGGASVPLGATASASSGGSSPLLMLLGGIVGSVSSVAKAAITANSARAVAQMNNAAKSALASKSRISDFQKLSNGRYRTTTWLE